MEGQLLSVVAGTGTRPSTTAVSPPRTRLGEILCAKHLITKPQLASLLLRQRTMAAHLGALLQVENGLAEHDLLAALEDQWGARRIDLEAHAPDPTLIQAMGLEACLQHRMVPWRRIGAATVIAAVYPERFEAERPALEALFGPVMLALTSETGLRRSLNRCLPLEIRHRNEARLTALHSCRAWTCRPFRLAAIGLSLGVVAGFVAAPVLAFWLLTCLALLALISLTALKTMAGVAAFRRPAAHEGAKIIRLHPPTRLKRPVVSLLVPLYREDRIAERLLRRLQRIKYPAALLDICLIVESDDTVTRDCLKRTVLPVHIRVLTVPEGMVKTKPRAMNHALDHCRGSIVGVYDAEDAPDPDQIAHVVTRFNEAPPDIACLQGRLSFYNARQNWLSRCFTIDYAVWFTMVLPGISRMGLPIPLGGTTLFFRREVLEKIGAWDAFNVTEDADLGIRLYRHGYRTELIVSTTMEEANCRIWPWIRQRSRWMKGYAMTYATHMRRPRQLWRDLGPRGFFAVQVILLSALVQALLAPALWSWWLIALGLPHPLQDLLSTGALIAITAVLILCEGINLALAVLALRRSHHRALTPWILALNPYFMLQSLAALKALVEMAYRPFFWDKTEHGLDETPAPGTGLPA
ncbi:MULTISPECIES: glycosyltransferase [unclassified Meridianimarinicoccus]|uniref:glycosyltransferase n=1 Tax=unclassified Meridianimarinicoccus TaxID=2923344 RepID=UPI001865D39C|nr:glycosyltransferase [Fluviibacterium sp. MJW13]